MRLGEQAGELLVQEAAAVPGREKDGDRGRIDALRRVSPGGDGIRSFAA